jgi:hypothetical protein
MYDYEGQDERIAWAEQTVIPGLTRLYRRKKRAFAIATWIAVIQAGVLIATWAAILGGKL